MTRPPNAAPPGGGSWLRDLTTRYSLVRIIGLVLVLALVLGAVAVRLLDGDRAPRPVPANARDTVNPPAVDRPGAGPGSVNGMAASDTTLDLSTRGFPEGEEAPDTVEPEPIYVPPTPPQGWAAADAPSPRVSDPVPDTLRVPKPRAVRGIYIGSWSAGSRRRLPALLALADDTELNTFVVDLKDATGEVSYETEVPLAVQVEASRRIRIPDIEALLDSLRAHHVYPIARIVAFKDPLLAVARPEWAVVRDDGTPWEDDHGVRWVDSFNRNVWDYNIELAREAAALGFAEIQWDYVRFPDVPEEYMVEAVYPTRAGRTKTEAIREFLGYARDRLDGLDVPMTADVFGITTSATRDVGIGQDWERMSDRVDVLLPMVYPSHYPPGTWDYPNPNAAPYQIVRRALDAAVDRSRDVPGAAAIRPWLQAFTLGKPEYTPMHIRAQIDAVYDVGLNEWILWHPRVRYPIEAFVDANGIEPWFAGMGEALYQPEPGAAEEAGADSGDGAVDAARDEGGR